MLWLLILCFSGAVAQLPDPQRLVSVANGLGADSACHLTGDRLATEFYELQKDYSTDDFMTNFGEQIRPCNPAKIITKEKVHIWYFAFGVKTMFKETPVPRIKHYFFLFKGKCANSDGDCCSIIQSYGNTEDHKYNLKAYLTKYPPTHDLLINNNENVIGLEYVPDKVLQMPMPCETMSAAFAIANDLILNEQHGKLEVNAFINDWFIKQDVGHDIAGVWSQDHIAPEEGNVQLFYSTLGDRDMSFLESRMNLKKTLKKKLNKKRTSISN